MCYGRVRPRLCENSRIMPFRETMDVGACDSLPLMQSRREIFVKVATLLNRFDQGPGANQFHCTLHVVGKHVQPHLGTHPIQGFRQEVR